MIGAKSKTECGYLVVPEVRGDPGSALIRLPYAVLRGGIAARIDDPIVMVTGGPGGTIGFDGVGINDWRKLISRSVALQQRDVILLEQRGSGLSEPSLDCTEFNTRSDELIEGAPDGTKFLRAQAALLKDCRDRLVGGGRILTGYTTSAIATDIAELVKVLGYNSWNLYGVSYGTQVALTVMRDHPQGLRSVVLDSPLPLQVPVFSKTWTLSWSAMDKMFDACAANRACNSHHPDLRALYDTTVKELNDDPWIVKMRHPKTGETMWVPLAGPAVTEILLYSLAFAGWNEAVIGLSALARRDEAYGEFLAYYFLGNYIIQEWSEGAFYAVMCQDEDPFADEDGVRDDLAYYAKWLGKPVAGAQELVCREWNLPASGPVERQPVRSNIPTLILSGEFDPLTPPELAQIAHDDLGNSYLVEFADKGHALAFTADCAPLVISEFVKAPTKKPDPWCLKRGNEPFYFGPQP